MIYFMQSTSGGSIKIGYSGDVEHRREALESRYGIPLSLLKVMPGGRDEERAIHARFASHRIGRTEQFRPAPDLLEFWGRPLIVGANPDAVVAVPETKEKTISVRLELYPDDHERLKITARARRLSLAAYVRLVVLDAIRKDIKETKS